MRLPSLRYFITGIFSVSLGLGCGSGGPPLGTVIGTVTMNGEPVRGVNVIFVPEGKGSPSYGGTNKNGEFRLLFNRHRAGAQLGTHNVLIESPEPITDDSGKPINSTPIVKIPKKYRQHGSVRGGRLLGEKNELEFEFGSGNHGGQEQRDFDSMKIFAIRS